MSSCRFPQKRSSEPTSASGYNRTLTVYLNPSVRLARDDARPSSATPEIRSAGWRQRRCGRGLLALPRRSPIRSRLAGTARDKLRVAVRLDAFDLRRGAPCPKVWTTSPCARPSQHGWDRLHEPPVTSPRTGTGTAHVHDSIRLLRRFRCGLHSRSQRLPPLGTAQSHGNLLKFVARGERCRRCRIRQIRSGQLRHRRQKVVSKSHASKMLRKQRTAH